MALLATDLKKMNLFAIAPTLMILLFSGKMAAAW